MAGAGPHAAVDAHRRLRQDSIAACRQIRGKLILMRRVRQGLKTLHDRSCGQSARSWLVATPCTSLNKLTCCLAVQVPRGRKVAHLHCGSLCQERGKDGSCYWLHQHTVAVSVPVRLGLAAERSASHKNFANISSDLKDVFDPGYLPATLATLTQHVPLLFAGRRQQPQARHAHSDVLLARGVWRRERVLVRRFHRWVMQ